MCHLIGCSSNSPQCACLVYTGASSLKTAAVFILFDIICTMFTIISIVGFFLQDFYNYSSWCSRIIWEYRILFAFICSLEDTTILTIYPYRYTNFLGVCCFLRLDWFCLGLYLAVSFSFSFSDVMWRGYW